MSSPRRGGYSSAASKTASNAQAKSPFDSLPFFCFELVGSYLQIDDRHSFAACSVNIQDALDRDEVWDSIYTELLRYARTGSEAPHHSLRCWAANMFPPAQLQSLLTPRLTAAEQAEYGENRSLLMLPSPPYAANINADIVRLTAGMAPTPGTNRAPLTSRGLGVPPHLRGHMRRGGPQQQQGGQQPGQQQSRTRPITMREENDEERNSDTEAKQARTARLREAVLKHVLAGMGSTFSCERFQDVVFLAVCVAAPRYLQHIQLGMELDARLDAFANNKMTDRTNNSADAPLRQADLLVRTAMTEHHVRRTAAVLARDTAIAVVAAEKSREAAQKREAAAAARKARRAAAAALATRLPTAVANSSNNSSNNNDGDDDDNNGNAEEDGEQQVPFLERRVVPLRCTKHFWLWLRALDEGLLQQARGADVLASNNDANFKHRAAQGLGMSIAGILFMALWRVGFRATSWLASWLRDGHVWTVSLAQTGLSIDSLMRFPGPSFLSQSGDAAMLAALHGAATAATANTTAADALLNGTAALLDKASSDHGVILTFIFWGFRTVWWAGSGIVLSVLGFGYDLFMQTVGALLRDAAGAAFDVLSLLFSALSHGDPALISAAVQSQLAHIWAARPTGPLALALLATGVVGAALLGNVPMCRGVPAALRWTHLKHKLLHDAMTGGANRAADWWIIALCTVARVTIKAAWAPAVSVWSAVTAAVRPEDVVAALRSVAVDVADFALGMVPQVAQAAVAKYAAAASASASATPAVANAVAAVLAAAGWASTHGGPVARWLLANGPTAHIAAANFLLFADRSPSRSDGLSSFSAVCFLISIAIAAFKPWVDQIAPYTLRPKKEGMMERAQDVFMSFLAARKPWSASRFAESGAARRVATYLATGLSETDDDDCDLQLCLRHADEGPLQGGGPTAHARAASSRAARLTKRQQQQGSAAAAAVSDSEQEQQRRRRSSGPLYAGPLADLSVAGTLGKIHGGASPGLDARLCIQLAATSALNAALCIVRWRNYCDGASLYRVVGTEVVLRAAVSLCEYAVARAFA